MTSACVASSESQPAGLHLSMSSSEKWSNTVVLLALNWVLSTAAFSRLLWNSSKSAKVSKITTSS